MFNIMAELGSANGARKCQGWLPGAHLGRQFAVAVATSVAAADAFKAELDERAQVNCCRL